MNKPEQELESKNDVLDQLEAQWTSKLFYYVNFSEIRRFLSLRKNLDTCEDIDFIFIVKRDRYYYVTLATMFVLIKRQTSKKVLVYNPTTFESFSEMFGK